MNEGKVGFQNTSIFDKAGSQKDGKSDSKGSARIEINYGKDGELDSLSNLKLQNPGIGNFGRSIINAGDMNGDKYDDIVVTAPRGTITSGFVFIYGGGPDIDGNYDAGKSMSLDSRFGTSVASLGDINGDGLSDIIVGAPEYDFGISNKGYWGVFLGDTNIIVTDVKTEELSSTAEFQLYQNYPNPFNPTTVIGYRLPVIGNVKITIYDILGRRIKELINTKQQAGRYEVMWDASSVASGVYLYQLRTKDYISTKKMILLK